MPNTPYYITHLSDLHLTAKDDDERTEPVIFKRRLTGMNAAFRKVLASPDVQRTHQLVITGDVTDRGDLAAWHVFWNAVNDAGLRTRTLVVPGNHDVCCLGARLPLRKEGYHREDLDRGLQGLALGPGQPASFPWSKHVEERVVLHVLNSNNLGNLTAASNAMGKIGFHQLSGLASKMARYRDVPVKIVALHHSPNIPDSAVEARRGLKPFTKLSRVGHQIEHEQQMALQLLCITQRVRLVLHGHLHRLEVRRVGGVRYVGAPATTEIMTAEKGGPRGYTFLQYKVAGPSNRVYLSRRQVLP